jgi:small glutamine-rich tetratricopeptide repeat-containing protein alpha
MVFLAPVQCIGEAFGVDVADEAQKQQLSVKPANLMQIFDVYLKTEAKRKGGAAPAEVICYVSSAAGTGS